MKNLFVKMLKEDSGAITSSWVLITGLIIVAAIAALEVIAPGANTAANDAKDGIGTGYMSAAQGSGNRDIDSFDPATIGDDGYITAFEYASLLNYMGDGAAGYPTVDQFTTTFGQSVSVSDFMDAWASGDTPLVETF